MDKVNDIKRNFLSLYNQLEYDYKCIVLNTFRGLATYEDIPETGYKPYDVVGVIDYYQDKKGYTDQNVCDMVNNLLDNDEEHARLYVDNYRRMKRRNTQSSKMKTNWLELIAQVLEFDVEEYHNYLSEEGLEHTQKLVTILANDVNSIDTLYDLLSPKEKRAIEQLTMSLLKLCSAPEYNTEFSEYEAEDSQEKL